jgi:hypothetical protein
MSEDQLLPDYTAQHPRTQTSPYSPPGEPKISLSLFQTSEFRKVSEPKKDDVRELFRILYYKEKPDFSHVNWDSGDKSRSKHIDKSRSIYR